MKDKRASITAEYVAFARALASEGLTTLSLDDRHAIEVLPRAYQFFL